MLSCLTGGFPSLCHNEIRDTLGALVSKVTSASSIEPVLQPLTGEVFNRKTTATDPEARLDIYARRFWSQSEDAFFDVRVVNPKAPSYGHLTPAACYRRAEREKKESISSELGRLNTPSSHH